MCQCAVNGNNNLLKVLFFVVFSKVAEKVDNAYLYLYISLNFKLKFGTLILIAIHSTERLDHIF